MSPKGQATKEEMGKLDLTKIKNICSANDTIKKVKKIHTLGENTYKLYLL